MKNRDLENNVKRNYRKVSIGKDFLKSIGYGVLSGGVLYLNSRFIPGFEEYYDLSKFALKMGLTAAGMGFSLSFLGHIIYNYNDYEE